MRFALSLAAAWSGLVRLFREEPNARLELAILEVVVLSLGLLGFPLVLTLAAAAMAAVVLGLEAQNAAVERTLDRFAERSPAIGQAKDLAAGGVLIAAIVAALMALLALSTVAEILARHLIADWWALALTIVVVWATLFQIGRRR
ncbi:MAG: diacylglycerol kinase [Sulfobacillus sp.]